MFNENCFIKGLRWTTMIVFFCQTKKVKERRKRKINFNKRLYVTLTYISLETTDTGDIGIFQIHSRIPLIPSTQAGTMNLIHRKNKFNWVPKKSIFLGVLSYITFLDCFSRKTSFHSTICNRLF